MTNNILARRSLTEDENIDRNQIVNGDDVPDEYFCPICQYLLCKPRSCSSCQHLFCQKCIRTWIENPSSGKRCPFRCQSFEERPCPPSFQSLLSHLNIYCRNSEFGCKQILSYDQLEHHENVECQYPSKRCPECDKLVLVSLFDEHQRIVGLCIPCPIKCTICENFIEKHDFRKHFYDCRQRRIDQLNILTGLNQNLENLERILNNQPITTQNTGLTFVERLANNLQLIEQQREMARLPTSLKGVNAVRRAQEQNFDHLNYILIMLKFILTNWRKIPYFLYTLVSGAFVAIGAILLGFYVLFSYWIYTHICFGTILLIFLTYLSSYGTYFICQNVFDSTIIFCFTLILFLFGCSVRMSLEIFEDDYLFDKPILCIVWYSVGIFLFKMILLLIRLYFWSMPMREAAGLLSLINWCITYKVYRFYEDTRITQQINQLRMPV